MNSHGASVKVTQFALRLSFSSTGHKLQGQNVKSDLVVHGYKKTVPKCLYYVMLSRCTTIDNVYLDDDFDLDKIQCSSKALKEVERLDSKSLTKDIENQACDIFYMNIRSFSKHKEDLFKDLIARKSKHICLAETWMDNSKESPFAVTESEKLVYHSSFGRGKGCSILTGNGDQHHLHFSVCTEKFQILSMPIENFQLTVVYVSSDPTILQDLKKALEQTMDHSLPQLVLGDFNFDSAEENCLTNYLQRLGLLQVISQPTQKEGRTLDHLYVPANLKDKVDVKVQFKYFSDHASLQIKLNC